MKPTLMPRRVNSTVSGGSTASPTKRPALSTVLTSSGQAPTPKATACYTALFHGTEKPAPYDVESPERFYFDLFLLSPDTVVLRKLCSEISDQDLLVDSRLRNNLRELFQFSVQCLKGGEDDTDRVLHVLVMLSVVLRDILPRSLPNKSLAVLTLLCGSIAQADVIMPDFTLALDTVLQTSDDSVLKGHSLTLTLLVVSTTGQGALNSYFQRRDLFTSMLKLAAAPETAYLTSDGFLVAGLLANYHKYETRNAMLVRFEDLVDDGIMSRIRNAVTSNLELAKQTYLDVLDAKSAGLAGQLAGAVSMLWPFGYPTFAQPAANGRSEAKPAKTLHTGFRHDVPSHLCAVQLPLYDLINSNRAFCAFLLHPPDDSTFLSVYLSLASYQAAHAAISVRSRLYAHLTLSTISIMVEEGAQTNFEPGRGVQVDLYRQRQSPIPAKSDQLRPLACTMLDILTIFLRANLTRRDFQGSSYLLALRTVHKLMHQLRSSRKRLDYNWSPFMQATLALAKFLQVRQADLCDVLLMEEVVEQLLLVLDFALVWSEALLPAPEDIAKQLYEFLRAGADIAKLAAIANPPSFAPLSPRLPSPNSTGTPSKSSWNGSLTPKSPTANTPLASPRLPPEPSGPTAQSVRNFAVLRTTFRDKIDDFREKNSLEYVDEHDIMNLIRTSMQALDLRESIALEQGGMRKYDEHEFENVFKEIAEIVANDAAILADYTEAASG